MAAAPFTGLLTLAGTAGGSIQLRLYFSDVAAAKAKIDSSSGSDFIILPTGQDWVLMDLSLSAAGTDTTNSQLRVNDQLRPTPIINAQNVYTSGGSLRQFQQAHIGFLGGAKVELVQQA